MPTLREQAKAFTSMETKNICDLKSVSTEIDVKSKTVNDGTPEAFSYDYVVVNGIEYRVPKTVLKQLKAQLESKPSITKFKVVKKGEGIKTEYTVVTLD